MPFKSKSQQRYMYANMPDTAEKWAKETPNIKGLPQHVKKEAIQPEMEDEVGSFWVVTRPTEQSVMEDIVFESNVLDFANRVIGGLQGEEVIGVYKDEATAVKTADRLILDIKNRLKALEEKKELVTTKLQKKIDELQKLAETHMKAMKAEPDNAEAHQMKAEGYLARIKELRGKHKSVEKAKKPLEEKEGEDDLKHKKVN